MASSFTTLVILPAALGPGGTGGGGSLTISGTPPAGRVGTAYAFTPTVSGGTPPYSFTLQSGTLPAGETVNSATGITGTPTGV